MDNRDCKSGKEESCHVPKTNVTTMTWNVCASVWTGLHGHKLIN